MGKESRLLTGATQAHQSARNEGAPLVPPGLQRTTGRQRKALQAAPARKPLASRSMRFRPQTKRGGVRGQPWCCLGLAATGRPLVLSREWERTPPTSADVQRSITPPKEKERPCPRHGQKPSSWLRYPSSGGSAHSAPAAGQVLFSISAKNRLRSLAQHPDCCYNRK